MAKNFSTMGETVIGGLDSSDNPLHTIVDRSGALVSMSREHYEVHRGNNYFFTAAFELASGGLQEYLIQTPEDISIHMHFVFDGSAITQFDLYEDSEFVGTTDNIQTIFNNNRNSLKESSVILYASPTTDANSGTPIKTYKGGSATNQSVSGETEKSEREIILKKNAKYLIRYTSGAAENLCDMYLHWYEVST